MEKLDKQFLFILFAGLLARVFAIHLLGDNSLENEWGILVKNLEEAKIFGYRTFSGEVLPTIYMPPFYAYFLYILKTVLLLNETYYINFVLYSQLLLSLITVIVFKKLLEFFFSNIVTKIGVITFVFFPLNVYCVTQISSVCIYIFLSVLYLYFLFLILTKQDIKNFAYFSIVSSFLILVRGEFFIIYFLSLAFLYVKTEKFKLILTSILITLFLISPYLIRNYIVFDTLTITKTTGYNLWKGNNQFSNSEGYEEILDETLKEKVKNIKISKKYDLDYDNIFKQQAIKNLKEDPFKYFVRFIQKNISFYLLDFQSSYPNYYNYLHIIPKVVIGVLALIGGFISLFKKKGKEREINFFLFYYIFYGSIFSVFFILPRYSLMLLPIQIILLCILLSEIKYLKRFK